MYLWILIGVHNSSTKSLFLTAVHWFIQEFDVLFKNKTRRVQPGFYILQNICSIYIFLFPLLLTQRGRRHCLLINISICKYFPTWVRKYILHLKPFAASDDFKRLSNNPMCSSLDVNLELLENGVANLVRWRLEWDFDCSNFNRWSLS